MYFFLNALLLLLSFLSMISHGLVFPCVHLYLLLYHPVPFRFFLSFSFSVVLNVSLRESVVPPSQFFFFSCFLKHLLFFLIYTPFTLLSSIFCTSLDLFLFLPHLYNFLLSKFFTFVSFFSHIPHFETKL